MTPWRVGTRVPRHVYRGDEPICTMPTEELAREVVAAMNTYGPTGVASAGSPPVPCAVGGATSSEVERCSCDESLDLRRRLLDIRALVHTHETNSLLRLEVLCRIDAALGGKP